MSCVLFFDGACRGNPGPMAIGVVLFENGKKVKEISKSIGIGTNNIAEWRAVIEGLRMAIAHDCKEIEVRGDSQLIIRQISGTYKVKSKNLVPLFKEAQKLCENFSVINFKWIRREENSYADSMVNAVLDLNKK